MLEVISGLSLRYLGLPIGNRLLNLALLGAILNSQGSCEAACCLLIAEERRTTLMKFLAILIQKQQPPPEIMPALVEATIQWMAQAKGSSKFDAIFSIAGQPGGGGICNVDSLEELDDLIQGYPMTPFCDVQTFPLSDVDHALATMREQVKKMGAPKG